MKVISSWHNLGMTLSNLWGVITFQTNWFDANIFLVLIAIGIWYTIFGFILMLIKVIFDKETWKKN